MGKEQTCLLEVLLRNVSCEAVKYEYLINEAACTGLSNWEDCGKEGT